MCCQMPKSMCMLLRLMLDGFGSSFNPGVLGTRCEDHCSVAFAACLLLIHKKAH